MSMMDPTQVLLPPDGTRHAFFIDFVQNMGSLQRQVQFQRQDKNRMATVGENGGSDHGEGGGDERDIRELQEFFLKQNPLSEEFVPWSLANGSGCSELTRWIYGNGSGNGNGFVGYNGRVNGLLDRAALWLKKNYAQGRRKLDGQTSMAQQEEVIQRTVYVSNIVQQVTEEQLAALFVNCGQVVDCCICGDPNSVLRFTFIEFTDGESA